MKKITLIIITFLAIFTCKNNPKTTSNSVNQPKKTKKYPSDVIPFMDEWKILLGDGTYTNSLVNYEKKGFSIWVVYKTPNSGVTSRTSSNTRTELVR